MGGMRSMTKGPTILVDTREQRPYQFPRQVVATLPTGDYSLVVKSAAGTQQHGIVVERKTKEDLFSSLGQRRARFEREMQRMAGYDYAALVIEATLDDLLRKPPFMRANDVDHIVNSHKER